MEENMTKELKLFKCKNVMEMGKEKKNQIVLILK